MAANRFRFVSPGIFLKEIDESQIPADPEAMGPIIIGRAQRGPIMRPVKVSSKAEFREIFGNAKAYGGSSWVGDNHSGPTYAAYGAEAYLDAEVGPVTFLRLGGTDDPLASSSTRNGGVAGWTMANTPSQDLDSNGGAYGMFVAPVAAAADTAVTGTLAGVFYVDAGGIVLSGKNNDVLATGGTITGSMIVMTSSNAVLPAKSAEFTAIIENSSRSAVTHSFTFGRTAKGARAQFNTNPELINSTINSTNRISDNRYAYFLGQTFERSVAELSNAAATKGHQIFIAPLVSGSTATNTGYASMLMSYQKAQTTWFFGQDFGDKSSYNPESMTRLFRFIARDYGEWANKNIKVSLTDITYGNLSGSYGSFTVEVRALNDKDTPGGDHRVLEAFSNCNIDPRSENYVGRRIGTKYVSYDYDEKRLREYGEYENRSKYIYADINPDVENQNVDKETLPFGVYGPPRSVGFSIFSGASAPYAFGTDRADIASGKVLTDVLVTTTSSFSYGAPDSGDATGPDGDGKNYVITHPDSTEIAFRFPAANYRSSSLNGGVNNYRDAYWGFAVYDEDLENYDPGTPDYLARLPYSSDYDTLTGLSAGAATDTNGNSNGELEYPWIVSLDDLRINPENTNEVLWESGSRASGESMTAVTASGYKAVLDHLEGGSLTAPMYGGYDGLNITEAEPFRNTLLDDSAGGDGVDNYAYSTIIRALNTVSDGEQYEANLMAMPGVTEPKLTKKMVEICEARGDALAIVDIQNVFIPKTEGTAYTAVGDRPQSVTSARDSFVDRQLNSSYGCTYYPWLRIRDSLTSQEVYVPPSTVMLGVFAHSELKSDVWFAPAGFNRGGLSRRQSGLFVTDVSEKLTSRDRDTLYQANINPIASFPSEGIVVFGQKTMQMTRSALDRINVRRLLIFVKKEISRIAAGVLFDNNVQATWARFQRPAEDFLSNVQAGFGLTAFKVLLDETTTTPDMIDRNILYAKIFLQPARSIEFIAVDFVIQRTGASFDD